MLISVENALRVYSLLEIMTSFLHSHHLFAGVECFIALLICIMIAAGEMVLALSQLLQHSECAKQALLLY